MRSGTATRCQVISLFYLHIHAFIRGRNEPYLPLPSQLKLVLIYRPEGQPERWVNSRPRTATQCLSRLLTGQSITPHWASRCTQPAQSCCREWYEAAVKPRPFESQVQHANHYTTGERVPCLSLNFLLIVCSWNGLISLSSLKTLGPIFCNTREFK